MEELLPLLVVGAAVLAAIYLAVGKPPALFVVRVRDGRAEAVRGKVTDAFLEAVADVFREFEIKSGEVRGVPRGPRISLWFSGLPPRACQRLRNWWAASGWSASPRRA